MSSRPSAADDSARQALLDVTDEDWAAARAAHQQNLAGRSPDDTRRWTASSSSTETATRRSCWRGRWCRWWRPRGSGTHDGAEVDPSLIRDNDTDRLFAGVARLMYHHIESSADRAPSSDDVRGSFHRSSPSTAPALSESVGGGRSLTNADFEEAQFLPQRRCFACFKSRRSWLRRVTGPPRISANTIFKLVQSVAKISEFRKEVTVVLAIYVERLLSRNPELSLSASNWRPILVAACHLASKTWEDVHPWNAEVAAYLRDCAGVKYQARSLYALESLFLYGLGYRVDVPGQLYASYYFSMLEGQDMGPEEVFRSGGSLPGSPNLSPHLGALGGRQLLPRGGALSIDISDPVPTSPSGQVSSHVNTGDHLRLEAVQAPKAEAGMVRSSTWNHALTHSDSFSRDCEDSVPTTPVVSKDDCKRSSSPPLGSDAISSIATVSTAASSGLECSYTARKLRRQLQLDAHNPYMGFFRHAPRAPAPSSMMRKMSKQTTDGSSSSQPTTPHLTPSTLSPLRPRLASSDSTTRAMHRRGSV